MVPILGESVSVPNFKTNQVSHMAFLYQFPGSSRKLKWIQLTQLLSTIHGYEFFMGGDHGWLDGSTVKAKVVAKS